MENTERVVHINSYFLSNKIHYNLYRSIIEKRNDEFLIPVYNHFYSDDNPEIDIDYIFNSFDKKVFFTKIPKVLSLFNRKKYRDFNCIHAHTLISDGIPGWIISSLKGKDLMISVRNTDISIFIEKNWFFRYIGKRILKRAKAVFFISPSLRRRIEEVYPDLDTSKFHLLPNGLDAFWFQNKIERKLELKGEFSEVRLLFVGNIIPRKNLEVLLKFIQSYSDRRYSLTVVGRNKLDIDFESFSRKLPEGNSLKYIGEVYDKEKLKTIFDSHDVFVLLSKAETFGVAYVEAMSRGLPIIYTENEGMDGYFQSGEVGYPNKYDSVEQLKENLDLIINHYDDLSFRAIENSTKFSWKDIVKTYIETTKQALNS